jgi:hypothetical protein
MDPNRKYEEISYFGLSSNLKWTTNGRGFVMDDNNDNDNDNVCVVITTHDNIVLNIHFNDDGMINGDDCNRNNNDKDIVMNDDDHTRDKDDDEDIAIDDFDHITRDNYNDNVVMDDNDNVNGGCDIHDTFGCISNANQTDLI